MSKDYQNEHFETQGYTIIDEAFSEEELLLFQKTFKKVIKCILGRAIKDFPQLGKYCKSDNYDEILLALRYANPEYVSIIQRIISRSPEFYRLSSSQKLFGSIRELLYLPDESPLYLLSNGIVFTNPNDKENKRTSNFELDWHQDTFFTIPQSHFVQFWGPVFHDSTEDLGTLVVCPGSHKNGYGKQRIHTEISFNHRFSMEPSEIEKYQPISINLKLGQILVFHGHLIHASGYNSSKKVRMTILGLCHDASRDECVPVSTKYLYHGKTPEAWFYDLYGEKKAKEIMYEQAAPIGEPPGGI